MRRIVFALGAAVWVSSPALLCAEASVEAEPGEAEDVPLEAPSAPALEAAVEPVEDAAEPVELVVVGSPEELSRVRGVVAAWRLGDRELSWQRAERFESSALFDAPSESPLRCWIDLSRGADVRLYFVNGRTQRFMVRSLETSGKLDELDREALGQAIELSLLALLEDRAAGLSRQDAESLLVAPPPAPAPPPKRPAPPAAPRFEASVFYSVVPILDRHPLVHGPGGEIAVAVTSEPRLLLFAAGQYRFADTWRDPLGELHLQSTALRAGAELAPRLQRFGASGNGSLRLAIRLNAGVDWLALEPAAGSETRGARTTPERRRVDPVVGTALQALLLLPNSISLRLGGLLDVAPDAVQYDVALDGERTTVFRALRLRPGGVVAVGAVW